MVKDLAHDKHYIKSELRDKYWRYKSDLQRRGIITGDYTVEAFIKRYEEDAPPPLQAVGEAPTPKNMKTFSISSYPSPMNMPATKLTGLIFPTYSQSDTRTTR